MGALVVGEDGGCEGADAAFALCAGYVDYVEAVEVLGLYVVHRSAMFFLSSRFRMGEGKESGQLTVWPRRAQ